MLLPCLCVQSMAVLLTQVQSTHLNLLDLSVRIENRSEEEKEGINGRPNAVASPWGLDSQQRRTSHRLLQSFAGWRRLQLPGTSAFPSSLVDFPVLTTSSFSIILPSFPFRRWRSVYPSTPVTPFPIDSFLFVLLVAVQFPSDHFFPSSFAGATSPLTSTLN